MSGSYHRCSLDGGRFPTTGGRNGKKNKKEKKDTAKVGFIKLNCEANKIRTTKEGTKARRRKKERHVKE